MADDRIVIRPGLEMKAKLEKLAKEDRRSVNSLIVLLIEKFLREKEQEKK